MNKQLSDTSKIETWPEHIPTSSIVICKPLPTIDKPLPNESLEVDNANQHNTGSETQFNTSVQEKTSKQGFEGGKPKNLLEPQYPPHHETEELTAINDPTKKSPPPNTSAKKSPRPLFIQKPLSISGKRNLPPFDSTKTTASQKKSLLREEKVQELKLSFGELFTVLPTKAQISQAAEAIESYLEPQKRKDANIIKALNNVKIDLLKMLKDIKLWVIQLSEIKADTDYPKFANQYNNGERQYGR
eukprot:TRINITY_DN22935_c0_g1_i1.p1 TRINITY_DN22935_c0_g1~~TRINITY_DN22935_c0_g1_i1.p1  ORF type:complete len:244 (-),score=27.73 TRINITY_DN22935_c0_g1_i1:482-1213(-)